MEPCIKGNQINLSKQYLTETFPPEVYSKLFDSLDEETRIRLTTPIFALSWKPEKLFIDLITTADKILGKGDYQLCHDIGRYIAQQSVSTIYKIFIRINTPTFVIKRAPTFWRQLHNHGSLEVTQSSRDHATILLHDEVSHSKAFCRGLIGFFERILELCGAKNISITVRCQPNKNNYCEFNGRWE
jgi:hypothetical protein